ncbi:hypothetical protein BGZ65_004005 [Modicella reniformis]|uniref:Uncharacterized protein n=1 Tax=Modicella reniformis TaxID=1440133 RepID=A0A9P6SLU5_9FUNG|nr:hypothetical protein BGZ65_004005 [Modicella reniformis]
MHSDSVWSLYSDHPQLATFYGGGKDGLVTKTEVNRYSHQHESDYEDEDSGQCVVICKADAGIARLVAHEDARIWTATSSSSVYQWPDIPTRANRSHELTASIVPANLLKMSLNDSTYAEPTPDHYYPTSTVYSAASLGSILVSNRDKQSQHSSEDDDGLITPIFEEPENIIEGEHGLIKHTLLNNRRMVVTEDKCGEVALWDIIKCVQLKTFPGRKMEDVVNELNTIESVPTWCTIDTRIGALTVYLDEGRCFDAEVYLDEIEETPDPERADDQRISIGKWVLKNLFDPYVPVHIDAYEKESYRIQHQDDPPTPTSIPTTIVTNEKNEVVHGGADAEEDDPAGGRPTTNAFPEGTKGLSTTEPPRSSNESANKQNTTPPSSQDSAQQTFTGAGSSSVNSSKQGSTVIATTTTTATTSTGSTSKPGSSGSAPTSSSGASTPSSTGPPTSANSSSSNGLMGRLKHSVKKLARTPSAEQKFENGRSRKISLSISTSGSFVSKAPNSPSIPECTSPSVSTTQAPNPLPAADPLPAAAGTGTGASTSTSSSPRTTIVESAHVPGESQGSGTTKTDDDQSTSDTNSSHSIESLPSPVMQLPSSKISVRPPHPPFTPPTNHDCPTVAIPPHIPVIISEQSREASSSVDLYRGSVGTLADDYVPLVQVIPTWLLELLLKNTILVKEAPKVAFALRPHHDQDASVTGAGQGSGRLGELPGGNPRLTAPRMLRVRKVIVHVVDKLFLSPPRHFILAASTPSNTVAGTTATLGVASGQNDDSQQGSSTTTAQRDSQDNSSGSLTPPVPPTSSSIPTLAGYAHDAPSSSSSSVLTSQTSTDHHTASTEESVTPKTKEQEEEEEEEESMRQLALRPENWLEILCNDQVLSPTMSLATIRTHYWKSGSDVVLTYRYKQWTTTTTSADASTSTLPVTTGSVHST